ncbi:MAG TPA: RNA 2',3'-cyclic phosphodiesterase [Streptosporangiaceae bacterium]|jgi:2'-5' RNA ligase
MRLFVAAVPPAEVRTDLSAALTPHQAERAVHRDLRWTGPADWHVTLAFLGDVPGPVAAGLGPALERAAARHRPFPLALAGAGAFPAAPDARVLWCGLGGDHAALAALAGDVVDAVTGAGAAPPDAGRPFRPHLTLARSRGRTPADVRDLVTALSGYASPSWPVDRIQLIDSDPGGRPRYSTIGHWPLSGDTLRR